MKGLQLSPALRVCLVMCLLLGARAANAQDSVLLLIPRDGPVDAAAYEHRLRAEVLAEGATPVSVETESKVSADELRQQAARLAITRAIGLSLHEGKISGWVWIRGKSGEGEILRDVPPYPIGPQSEAVFAVRATNILRGGLLELGYLQRATLPSTEQDTKISIPDKAPAHSAEDVEKVGNSEKPQNAAQARQREEDLPRTSAPNRLVHRSPSHWELRGLGTIATHFLNFPTNSGIGAALLYGTYRDCRLGILTNYLFSVTSKSEGNYGYARMSQLLVGLRLEHEDELLRRLALFESVEGGLHETIITSHALPPNRGHRPRAWTGYAQVGAGVRYSLGQGLALVAQVSLIVPFQRSPVVIGDEVIAQAAGPGLLNQAGVAVAF